MAVLGCRRLGWLSSPAVVGLSGLLKGFVRARDDKQEKQLPPCFGGARGRQSAAGDSHIPTCRQVGTIREVLREV